MAEKFNKYFNSTTINGRANVAKATYASFALMYLIYRIRKRGKNDAEPKETEGDCGCHGKMSSPHSEEHGTPAPAPPEASSGTKKKEDCPVCRDRVPKQQKDKEGANSGSEAQGQGSSDAKGKRRKCPCEDPHLHTDSDEWMLRKREYEANEPHDGCASYTPGVSITEDKPTNMHETIYRALRGMLGAVMGGGNDNANESNSAANGNLGNGELDFFKIKKHKIEENEKNDSDKARTKDDDYLDGIGSDMYNED